jgi:hypothetical protein
MLNGLHYAPDGSLHDDTAHSWRRVRDWVEPAEADTLVQSGTRYAVQSCQSAPSRGMPERFKRDVLRHMLPLREARSFREAHKVPTVMVGEVWRSDRDGDLLLFVERAPYPRSSDELADDWSC